MSSKRPTKVCKYEIDPIIDLILQTNTSALPSLDLVKEIARIYHEGIRSIPDIILLLTTSGVQKYVEDLGRTMVFKDLSEDSIVSLIEKCQLDEGKNFSEYSYKTLKVIRLPVSSDKMLTDANSSLKGKSRITGDEETVLRKLRYIVKFLRSFHLSREVEIFDIIDRNYLSQKHVRSTSLPMFGIHGTIQYFRDAKYDPSSDEGKVLVIQELLGQLQSGEVTLSASCIDLLSREVKRRSKAHGDTLRNREYYEWFEVNSSSRQSWERTEKHRIILKILSDEFKPDMRKGSDGKHLAILDTAGAKVIRQSYEEEICDRAKKGIKHKLVEDLIEAGKLYVVQKLLSRNKICISIENLKSPHAPELELWKHRKLISSLALQGMSKYEIADALFAKKKVNIATQGKDPRRHVARKAGRVLAALGIEVKTKDIHVRDERPESMLGVLDKLAHDIPAVKNFIRETSVMLEREGKEVLRTTLLKSIQKFVLELPTYKHLGTTKVPNLQAIASWCERSRIDLPPPQRQGTGVYKPLSKDQLDRERYFDHSTRPTSRHQLGIPYTLRHQLKLISHLMFHGVDATSARDLVGVRRTEYNTWYRTQENAGEPIKSELVPRERRQEWFSQLVQICWYRYTHLGGSAQKKTAERLQKRLNHEQLATIFQLHGKDKDMFKI